MNTLKTRILVRPYQPSDLEACRALWLELTEHHRQLYNDPTIGGENPGVYFDHHLERAGADHIWVAQYRRRVIGLVGLLVDGAEAEIEPIVVAQGLRSQGVGELLLNRAVAEARSLENVRYLNVRPVARNVDAILFFYEAGFRLLGRPELFMDFKQTVPDPWKPGPELYGCLFKI